MEFRQVGGSGLRVSLAGLGCNNFGGRLDQAGTDAVVHAALEAGITLFDTSDIYGGRGKSEEQLGKALAGHRDEVIIATKFGMPMADDLQSLGASRRWIRRAVEDSLRRLGTDRIDLYQLHAPDASVPVAETLDALGDLVRDGKVNYVGSSNFAGWQIAEADGAAQAFGRPRFVSAQNEWSLLRRRTEREVVPACEHLGISVLPYFPLASGLLTGKYRRGEEAPAGSRLGGGNTRFGAWLTDANHDRVDALAKLAAERGHGVGELAVAWLGAHHVVCSVIAGATAPEQVRANAAGADWHLDADDLAAVETALSDSRR